MHAVAVRGQGCGMLFQLSGGGDDEVDVVEVGIQAFPGLQVLLCVLKGRVLASREECGHEGVSLLPPLRPE